MKNDDFLIRLNNLLMINREISQCTFPLYHYTNIVGLDGILSNNTFHTSKSDFLNDRTEIIHFQDLYNNFISLINFGRSLTLEIERYREFCKSFAEYLEGKNRSFSNESSLFILSLTPISDLLPLWSTYTNNVGYNIGFKKSVINDFERNGYEFWYGNVVYNIENQYDYINQTMKEAFELCQEFNKSSNNCEDIIYQHIFKKFKLYAMFFKNQLFDSEQEVRIVFKRRDTDALFHRPRAGQFIPYIKINFNKESVESICVGPTNDSDITEIGLQSYLENNKYKALQINRSKIPLRY